MDSIFNPVTKVTYNVQPVPGAKDPIEILSLKLKQMDQLLLRMQLVIQQQFSWII
ncbi:MAG: hypothetical protein Ct9H90mP7_3320 [Candidatus Neomarinimicrobiota bacterium]|nr:MAG: hypothetical protein Ct9H90mP7_3320 [Candidatus Neomarinimicrobiota bacterium]